MPGILSTLRALGDFPVAWWRELRGVQTLVNVAALRASTSDSRGGATRVHTLCHTTPGWGGHTYHLRSDDMTSSDNGGQIVVDAEGGRWHVASGEVINAETFGAAPDYDWVNGAVHTNSTAALLAYCQWIGGTPVVQDVDGIMTRYCNEVTAQERPFRLGKGWYYIDQTIPLHSYYDVQGEGKSVTHVWWGGDPDSWPFEIGSDGAAELVWGFRFKGIEIAGGASCGASAVRVFGLVLDFDIDLSILGGFEKAFHVAYGTGQGGLGGMQWGALRLSDIPRPGTAHLPANMLWVESYVNACRIELQTRGLTGASCTLRNGYGGNYSIFTGTSQGDHIGFDVAPGATPNGSCFGMRVVDWKEEANTLPSYFEGATDLELTGGGLDNKVILQGCRDTKVINHLGAVDERNSVGTRYVGGLYSGVGVVERENASGVTDAPFRDYAHSTLANAAGFGISDPENIWPFGDFERELSADWGTIPGVWAATPVTAVKCGAGLSDTTHYGTTPHCYKVSTSGGSPVQLLFKLSGPLPGHMVGCYISASFKVKTAQNVASITYGAHPIGGNPVTYSPSGGSIDEGSGWVMLSGTYKLTADIIAGGIGFGISFPATHTVYLAECCASFGCVLPRIFRPCTRPLYSPTSRIESGVLTIRVVDYASIADVGQNVGFNNGDRVDLISPSVQTSSGGLTYVTEGYDRAGGVWVPRQHLTGLVP